VLVLEAPSASSAARAGLRKNDIVTNVGGDAITTVDDLKRSWQSLPPGAVRDITVFREQREQNLRIQK
jgi:S1-C subfamily serine protease